MNYQIASRSEKGLKKNPNELNGDCCQWLEQDDIVVLALADGLGACASDSRASRTACNLFIEKCGKAISSKTVLDEALMERFCAEIDPVLAVDGDETCFCAIVWQVDTDKVTWFHVGDTRIYKYRKTEGLTQITTDDKGKAINVESNDKKYGKYRTDHGALIPTLAGVSATIGDQMLKYHTGTLNFMPGESLVLCSDGMYESATFVDDVAALLDEADIAVAIRKVTSTDTDDNSLLVIRRNADIGDRVSLHDLMRDFDDYKADMTLNALTDRFADELETLLTGDVNVDEVAQVVTFMKANHLFPDQKRIDSLFNSANRILKTMPEGDEKTSFNRVCSELKDILRFVFMHKR